MWRGNAGFVQLPQITAETRWQDAQALYSAQAAFQSDEALQQMDPIDFLTVFEDHMAEMERLADEARAAKQTGIKRTERYNRDLFKVGVGQRKEREEGDKKRAGGGGTRKEREEGDKKRAGEG